MTCSLRLVALACPLLVLAALACSPGQPGSDDGMTTTSASGGSSDASGSSEVGSAGTDEESGTGDPPDPTDTSSDTSGFDFLPPDETTGPVPGCDLLVQDCPEGEKCVPVFGPGGLAECVMITGEAGLGEACTIADGVDDCDGAHVCVDGPDGDGQGFCAPLCTASPNGPSCDEGMFCTQLGLCFGDRCDPLQPDPCPNSWPCLGRVGDGGARCSYLVGASYGGLGIGEVCATNMDCAEGSACSNGPAVPGCAGEFCCTAWCDPMDPDSCMAQPGTMCLAGGMMMNASYGRCVL